MIFHDWSVMLHSAMQVVVSKIPVVVGHSLPLNANRPVAKRYWRRVVLVAVAVVVVEDILDVDMAVCLEVCLLLHFRVHVLAYSHSQEVHDAAWEDLPALAVVRSKATPLSDTTDDVGKCRSSGHNATKRMTCRSGARSRHNR